MASHRIISTYAAPLYENGKVDGAVALGTTLRK